MTWGELKSLVGTAFEQISSLIATVYAWLAEQLSGLWQEIKGLALLAYEWLIKIFTIIQRGDFDSLPVDEIIIAIVVLSLCLTLLYQLLIAVPSFLAFMWIRIDIQAHRLAGIQPRAGSHLWMIHESPPRRQKVMREGRWSVYGYEDPYDSEKRRRAWQGKLMTPGQQQMHIAKVQGEERRKANKARIDPGEEGYDERKHLGPWLKRKRPPRKRKLQHERWKYYDAQRPVGGRDTPLDFNAAVSIWKKYCRDNDTRFTNPLESYSEILDGFWWLHDGFYVLGTVDIWNGEFTKWETKLPT